MSASLEIQAIELELRHPFGISRGSEKRIPTVLLRSSDGCCGEAAPVRYRGQNADAVAVELRRGMSSAPFDHAGEMEAWMDRHLDDFSSAARCGIETLGLDRMARSSGMPLWRLLGLPRCVGARTSFTIALDDLETMARKAAEAAEFPILKVKLGRGEDFDRAAFAAVRAAAPRSELWVDANAGWKADSARRMIALLADAGVPFVEQPLPIGALEETMALHRESPIPILLDEDVQSPQDVMRVAHCCGGVNVKLAKCGGPRAALRCIHAAREWGLRVLLGCMVETTVGITAATHIATAADWLDLDGALLVRNDPAITVPSMRGRPPWDVTAPEGAGLGVELLPPGWAGEHCRE